MDLSYSEEYEAFRAEVRPFLQENWTAEDAQSISASGTRTLPMGTLVRTDAAATRFRVKAIERGYFYGHVPKRYGGGEHPPDSLKSMIISEELRRRSRRT